MGITKEQALKLIGEKISQFQTMLNMAARGKYQHQAYEEVHRSTKNSLTQLFPNREIDLPYMGWIAEEMVYDEELLPIYKNSLYSCIAQLKAYREEIQKFWDTKLAPDVSCDVSLIIRLCKRIRNAARILENRKQKDKTPYLIKDEYDVQDLLHALIRGYMKYSVQENTLEKSAGTRASRPDISIEDLGVLIEVKYVRSPKDQKRIVNEFSQDLVLYAKWKPLKTLVLVIYNSDTLRDPEALEKLSDPKETGITGFDVSIILV